MPRALIFGMKHRLVNLYQVCSNYVSGAKKTPPQGSRVFIDLYREKHEKIFLSETIWPRALIFLVCIITLWTSTKFVQIMLLGPKMAPSWGHMFYTGLYKEKHEKIFLSKPQGLEP